MRSAACLLLLAGFLAGADDITTVDGKTYKALEFEKSLPEGAVFTQKGRELGIAWAKLPPELALKYRCEGGIVAARKAQRSLKASDGFRLDQLAEAKKKAAAEGKPLGFVMVWGSFFDHDGDAAQSRGSVDAFVHFYTVFNDSVVLVFVRHETELGAVPAAVAKGFNGPDEGGYSPNLAVVDPTAEHFICEIPGGANHKDVSAAEREKAFHAGIDRILAAKELWAKRAEETPKKAK
jgi:hypothetical protein